MGFNLMYDPPVQVGARLVGHEIGLGLKYRMRLIGHTQFWHRPWNQDSA